MTLHSQTVPCPSCGAPVGEPCRAITSHRVTDTHSARHRAADRRPRENRPDLTPTENRPQETL